MAHSQNGWPVASADDQDNGTYLGVRFPNGALKGDVAFCFRYLIGRLHAEVEAIIPGGCWGWYVKPIEGSSTISNHASGTAMDYNAPKHPMGTRNTYSAAQRDRIHHILNQCDGVFRWGGDYSGRPDDMHFEVVGTRAQVAALAEKIRTQQEELMATDLSDTTISKLAAATGKAVVDELLSRDLGKAGGGDTVGVVLQTGVLGNSTAALGKLDQIIANTTPAPTEPPTTA